jgi:hypothetical protein
MLQNFWFYSNLIQPIFLRIYFFAKPSNKIKKLIAARQALQETKHDYDELEVKRYIKHTNFQVLLHTILQKYNIQPIQHKKYALEFIIL